MGQKVHIQYYALMREERGISEEVIETDSSTVDDLYKELKDKYNFRLETDVLRVAINNEFSDWSAPLNEGDEVVFIPPVAGG